MASSSKEQELAIKIAGKVENSFKQSLGVTEDGLNKIASTAKKAAAVAAAAFAALKIGDFIADAVDEYSTFEQSMANTAAIASATGDEYDKLSNAAREAGKATTFTASEAADALGYMALAGWDVNESTTALTPILKLAEATQADLATTSDQVTDSMSAMGLGIDDLQPYLDAVVQTNNSANTSASDLMDAFIGCGGAARAAGMDYQDTATALGILANNGIKGSEAGTALNSMLVRISTKDVAQKAFKELGVAVYDSGGEMRNMQDILVDLNGAMADMTQEQKNSYMSAIAGTNYYSQFGYLLDGVKDGVDGSASAWDSLSEAIDGSKGALDTMDATVTNTLQGAMARFQSAVSDLKISLVEDFGPYATQVIDGVATALPKITENLSAMTQKMPVGDFMNGIGNMATGVFDFLEKITSGEGVVDALSFVMQDDFGVQMPGVVGDAIGVVSGFLTGMKDVASFLRGEASTAFQNIKEKIAENEPAISNVVQLASDLKDRLFEAFDKAKPVIEFIAETALPGIVDGLMTVVGGAADVLDAFTQWDGFLPTITGIAAAIAAGTVKTIAQTVATNAAAVAQGVLNAVMSVNPIMLIVIAIAALVAGLVVAYKKSEKFRNIVNKAFEGIKAVAGTVLTAVGAFFQKAWTVIKDTWDSFSPYFTRIWNALKTIFSVVASVLGGFFRIAWDVIKNIWQAVEPFFQNLWLTIKNIFSVVGSILGGFFRVAWAIIQGVWSVAGQYFTLIWNNIKTVFSAVGTVLGAFFSTAWEIIKAIWNVVVAYFQAIWNAIAGVFEVVAAVLSGDFAGAWEAIKGIFAGFASFFQTLWDSVVAIFSAVGSFFGTVFQAAWDMITGIFGNIVTFFSGVWDSIVGIFTTIGTAISDAISGAVKGAINSVLSGAAGIINGFISAINTAISIINAIPGVNIGKLSPMNVPQLAEGGIVSDPTLAMIGEGKQNEAVVPLDTLWSKMKAMITGLFAGNQNGQLSNALSMLTDKVGAMMQGASQTPIGGLLDKLNGTGGGTPQPQPAGMPPITYAPVYHFEGGAPSKDDLVEAEKMSQSEFNEMMERWQKDNDRKKF